VLIRSAGARPQDNGALNDGLAEPLTGLCSKAATSRAVIASPRIGVANADAHWSARKLRIHS